MGSGVGRVDRLCSAAVVKSAMVMLLEAPTPRRDCKLEEALEKMRRLGTAQAAGAVRAARAAGATACSFAENTPAKQQG